MVGGLLSSRSNEEGSSVAVVFSGIQPSGEIHLGNYIGAIRRFVQAQDVDETYFCIVDLHAITLYVPEDLAGKTLDLAAVYLAAGIDPRKSTLFAQSHVHEHPELAWILTCFTSFGELSRMTQFKDKSQRGRDGFVGAGLFAYPDLMAADILLYHTDRVPVGDDQRQHLELARDVAMRFNQRFGELFVVPEADIPDAEGGARIMDLQNPTAKMSKSTDSPQGTVKLTDDPDTINRKIKSAVTDSGREIVASPDKPAIANLLTIMSAATGRSIQDLEAAYEGQGYGAFKQDLAAAVIEYVRPVQERYRELIGDPAEISRLLAIGAERAQSVASKTLAEVYDRVGFLPGA
jgi:tryptophanyl-tRNA synthetase